MSAQRAQRIRNGVVSANPAFGDTCVHVRWSGPEAGPCERVPRTQLVHARVGARGDAGQSRSHECAGEWEDLAGAAGRRTVDEDRDGRHARRRQRRGVDARPRVRLRPTHGGCACLRLCRAVRCAVALVRISAQPCLPVSLRHPLHCAALRYRTERSTKTGFKGDSAAARLRNRDGDSVAARRVLYSIASACKRAQQFDRRTPSCKRSAA